MDERVIAVVGQTATGKSQLGIILAKKFHGAIVSADSRQVYRGLDIGSGKVSKREQRAAPHSLLDVADPRQVYTVAQYVQAARGAIQRAVQRGRVPIVVGGTGFWVDALLLGTSIPAVPPNPRLRKVLGKRTTASLFAQLKRLDPLRAKAVDCHNRVRLIRALEIILTTKKPVPPAATVQRYDVLWLGVQQPMQKLRSAIRTRLERRMRAGMVTEVRHLLQRGVPAKRLLNLGLEYRYVTRFLQRKITREEMLQQLETEIVRYAKRQRTWFRRNKNIHWVTNTQQAILLAKKFLRS